MRDVKRETRQLPRLGSVQRDRTTRPPRAPAAHPLAAQKRALGNQAVQRLAGICPLVSRGPSFCPFGGVCHTCPVRVQAKLRVGRSDDKYEREADRVADEVMRMPDGELAGAREVRQGGPPEGRVQRVCTGCEEEMREEETVRRQALPEEELDEEELVQRQALPEEELEEEATVQRQALPEEELEEEETVQRQALPEEEEEPVQASASPGQVPQVTPQLASRIEALRSGGPPLSATLRSFFEPRFGTDFGGVRVHTGPRAAEAARAVNARAFTLGHHVVFGRGQYQPESEAGRRLLAHELSHVIQQRSRAPCGTVQCENVHEEEEEEPVPTSGTPVFRRSTAPALPFPAQSEHRRDCMPSLVSTGGEPLPPAQRAAFEQALDHPLDQVRIHRGPSVNEAARNIRAQAFTLGADIYISDRQHVPGSTEGNELLAHELIHVVQQDEGRVLRSSAAEGVISKPADPLEREARAREAIVAHAADRALRGISEPAIDAAGSRRSSPLRGGSGTGTPILRYEITLERDAAKELTSASIESIRSQLSQWGVSDLGDLNSLNQQVEVKKRVFVPLQDSQIHQAMTTLEALRTMSGRGGTKAKGGYPSRIIATWNNHKDDLGPGRTYPTIIHFVVRLEELAHASMNMSYLEAIAAMPTVGLAGARFGVHPRAIYFVAAAQAEMDIAAGFAEGRGHYIAPGAFFIELLRIQEHARQLARPPRRRRPAESTDPQQAARDQLGVRVYNVMRRQVREMIVEMEAQAGGFHTARSEPGEHREPHLRDYLLTRADQLRLLPEATAPDEARQHAGTLDTILGKIPVAQRPHGWASIDPHGTDHAMGLAIDLFNGRGRAGKSQNVGVPEEFLPFVHRLIATYGPTAEFRGLRPTYIHKLSPRQARGLSYLLQEHGRELALAMRGEVPVEDRSIVRERQQALARYRQLAGRILQAYTQRGRILTRALSRRRPRRWYKGVADLRRQAQQARSLLRIDRRSFQHRSPKEVLAGLNERIEALEALYEQGVVATRNAEDWAQTVALQRTTARLTAFEEANWEAEERLRMAQMQAEVELPRIEQAIRESKAHGERQRLIAERKELTDALRRAKQQATGAGRQRREERLRVEEAAHMRRRQQGAKQRAAELGVLEQVRAAGGPSRLDLTTLQKALTDMIGAAQHAFEQKQEAAVRRVVSTIKFQRWLKRVADREHPLYDQPSLLIDAINRVIGHPRQLETGTEPHERTRFTGGHHWQVAERGILTEPATYEKALRRDMSQERRRAMIRRILLIMAESDGGRRALSGEDEHFMNALRSVYPEAETLVEEVLRIVGGGGGSALTNFLRQRGFHYLAGDRSE